MARRILGGAIVPAAPVLLAEVSPRVPAAVRGDVDELRDDVERTLRALPSADVVLIVDTGPRGIHQRVRADLSILGVADAGAELPVPASLLATATRITQYPLLGNEMLSVSGAVLSILVSEVIGTVPVVVATVPASAEGEMLAHVGAGLVEAVRGSDVTGVVVASGDLSAGLDVASPAYELPGASAWDVELRDAVAAQDIGTLHRLGPEAAKEAAARSWAAVVAAHGAFAAARLRPDHVAYRAPLGVGGLVAGFTQQDADEPGGRFRRDDATL